MGSVSMVGSKPFRDTIRARAYGQRDLLKPMTGESGGVYQRRGSRPDICVAQRKVSTRFHTVICPALIMGLNHATKGLGEDDPVSLPGPGDLTLETNVPAMEYLMLAGGQFSKSRKHAVWLPSFLERFDPDTLRYYLSINMPENHDTDFNWPDFVEKINNELNGTYGNYVNRVMSLGNKLGGDIPLSEYDQLS